MDGRTRRFPRCSRGDAIDKAHRTFTRSKFPMAAYSGRVSRCAEGRCLYRIALLINVDMKSKLLNMNRFQVLVLAMACCFLMACAVPGKRKVTTGSSNKKNVLFIAVDDLRPLLGAYGATQMKTPHIDSLIKDGVRFDNAYSNIAVCGASRASLISGIRPNAGRFSNYASWASEDVPGTKPLHAIFRENGYETVSLGKMVHNPEDFEEYWNRIDGRIN